MQEATGHHHLLGSPEIRYPINIPETSPLFAHHIIKDRLLLPDVVFLELALAICQGQALNNVFWSTPVSSKTTGLILVCDAHQRIQMRSDSGIHAEALRFAIEQVAQPLDFEAIRSRCTEKIDSQQLYKSFCEAGFDYGSAFQNLADPIWDRQTLVSRLAQQGILDHETYRLSPSLLNGALQAILAPALMRQKIYLPFSIDALEVYESTKKAKYVVGVIEHQEDTLLKGNSWLCDDAGKVLLAMKGVTFKAKATSRPKQAPKAEKQTPDTQPSPAEQKPEPTAGYDQLHYYAGCWTQAPERASTNKPARSILVFDHDATRLSRLGDRLPEHCILVMPGAGFNFIDENFVTLDLNRHEHFVELISELKRENRLPGTLLHLAGMDDHPAMGLDISHVTSCLSYGLEAIFHLTRAYLEQDAPLPEIIAVTPDTRNLPHLAAIDGFFKTLRLENREARVRHIELASHSDLECLPAEMVQEGPAHVRLDGKSRWVPGFRYIDSSKRGYAPMVERGIYLVTGGTGGLGLVIAHYLAKTYKARLILTGRSKYDWRIRRKLDAIRAMGGEAIYCAADVTDVQQMRSALTSGLDQFGPLQGVFHCAGIMRDHLLFNKDFHDFQAVLAPKTIGSLVLENITRDQPLELFVLFSSITSVLGNPGQADYTAGNAFMDSLASLMRFREIRCVAINWPLWREGGMSIDENLLDYWVEHTATWPLETTDGLEALELAIQTDHYQIVPIPGNRGDIEIKLNIQK